MKIKEILKKIGIGFLYALGTLFCGITFFFLSDKKKKKIMEEANDVREETKNELEKKSADDIAANSPNPDTISSNIEREQQEFRERVRNRLNEIVHRQGSSTDN